MHNYFTVAEECETCSNNAVVPSIKVVEYKGKVYCPIIMKCSNCGQEPDLEDIIKHIKENMI